MKKILFLMAIAITLQFAAKAQVTTCPGYTYPNFIGIDNNTNCDIKVNCTCFDRSTCKPLGTSPLYSFTSTANTAASYPLPSSFLALCGSSVNNVIMVNFSWDNPNCDGGSHTSNVQFEGPGINSNNCYSCGPYIVPGSGVSVLMPSCTNCNPNNTIQINWDSYGNFVIH